MAKRGFLQVWWCCPATLRRSRPGKTCLRLRWAASLIHRVPLDFTLFVAARPPANESGDAPEIKVWRRRLRRRLLEQFAARRAAHASASCRVAAGQVQSRGSVGADAGARSGTKSKWWPSGAYHGPGGQGRNFWAGLPFVGGENWVTRRTLHPVRHRLSLRLAQSG